LRLAIGARHAINPEVEGGLEMLRYTLLSLGHGSNRIQPYLDAVRTETYEGILPEEGGYAVLDQLLSATRGVEIAWELLNRGSPVLGHTLAEAGIRSRAGASVVAVLRGGEVITNPDTSFVFQEDDLVGMIGSSGQLAEGCYILNSPVG